MKSIFTFMYFLSMCVFSSMAFAQDGYKVSIYKKDLVQKGNTIFADLLDKPKIVEINHNGEITWEYFVPSNIVSKGRAGSGFDVKYLDNGNILFVLPHAGIYEVNRDKKIVWSYQGKVTHDANRLKNGNTLFVISWDKKDDSQVKEINKKGELVWQWKAKKVLIHSPYTDINKGGWTHVNSAKRLENGNTLISLRNFSLVVIVSPKGDIIRKFDLKAFGKNPHEPTFLPNGNLLFAVRQPHKAIEYNFETKKIVWQFEKNDFKTIRGIQRLRNGNTLITSRDEIVEVDNKGLIVWNFISGNVDTRLNYKKKWLYKAQRKEE